MNERELLLEFSVAILDDCYSCCWWTVALTSLHFTSSESNIHIFHMSGEYPASVLPSLLCKLRYVSFFSKMRALPSAIVSENNPSAIISLSLSLYQQAALVGLLRVEATNRSSQMTLLWVFASPQSTQHKRSLATSSRSHPTLSMRGDAARIDLAAHRLGMMVEQRHHRMYSAPCPSGIRRAMPSDQDRSQ